MATRRERVVLELEDHFTAGTLRAAAATELLDKKLGGLSKSSVQTARAQRDMESSVMGASRASDAGGKSIDKYSGRLGLLVDLATTLGPSFVPIAAVAIPAVTGLASALGIAALGAGTAVFAFEGVGDALDKVNKARLVPTATNLAAAREALDKLGPSARELVAHLANLKDQVSELRDAAASGLMPGVNEALDSILTRAPEVEKILHRVGHAVGEMLADGADSLASDRWDDFFDFIKTEAPPALTAMGQAVGNLTHAAAELWMAFGPLNGDALDWMVDATARIDDWAEGLSKTEGFQEFVDYIKQNGPAVGDTLGAIVMALLGIVEAAAPIGAVTLPILEAVADVVSAIANSDLGTPLIAFLALTRAVSLFDRGLQSGPLASIRRLGPDIKTMASTSVVAFGRATEETERYNAAAKRTRATLGSLAKGAGVIGGLALAQSGLADKVGLSNTALYASLGLMAGPYGAAVGGAVGLVMDFAKGQDVATASAQQLADAIDLQTGALSAQGYAAIGEAFAGLADDATKAGIPLSDVIQASVDGGDAMAALAQRIQDVIDADTYLSQDGTGKYLGDTAVAASNLSYALSGQNDEMTKAVDLAKGRKAGLDAASDAERDHKGAVDDTKGALEGLTAATDTNKDGVIDNTDAILDNIAAMEERTDAINAAFDAETNYQRSLQIGSDREKAAAEIRKEIADAEAQGAEDRADLQHRLAEARGELASARTPGARQSARDSINSIQGQINDSLSNQADTIKRLREQLVEYAPTLDKTTKAGQANRDVLSQMAGAWNNLSSEQQNAKGKFKEARDALIEQAKKFGASDAAAKRYADRLLEIPERIQTKILLEKQAAQAALDAYSAAFNDMDGKVAKTIIRLRIDEITGPGGKLDNGGKSSAPADGGKGGKGGGKGGRLVIPTQRLTAADVTRGSKSLTSRGGATADEIAAAVSRHARPMFDNVNFNSDGDFDRAQQLASSLASKGGA